ncbi:MAG: serine hydrolase [Candidatus Promineifilaceae bacterium]|nr:serine hydrolase [Candidatus Promineifilaceae bacterium]
MRLSFRILINFTLAMGVVWITTGCRQIIATEEPAVITPGSTPLVQELGSATPVPDDLPPQQMIVAPPATGIPSFTPTPPPTPESLSGTLPACGQLLPILPAYDGPVVSSLNPDVRVVEALRERVPEAALPALDRILDRPESVGLAAYRIGQEEEGVYLNENIPMPLASVVKVVHLVAYAEAVAGNRLNPTETVMLDDVAAYYLPNIDLGAHERALVDLEESGRIFGNPPAVLLDEVPGMMIAQSSNAATDYLHLLLGQDEIEQTAVELGLSSQTAPCPFLGQFLVMANHALKHNNPYQAWEDYMDDPDQYGRDVMLLTEAFSSDADFRETAVDWRRQNRQPNGQTQRLFSQNFNAHGSAGDYAALMARIAQNGLSNGESSYMARRFLEWPMRYPDNQALFTNLGYKNGSLPGILTTVYYAYPLDGGSPLVVALFYHDLERRVYQQWRDSFAHDELARWLLYDPQAISLLRETLN